MFKILFGKKLQELYDELYEANAKITNRNIEIEKLKEKIDSISGGKDCISGDHCKVCKNSYEIGFGMTPIHLVTYGCKLKAPCKKFEDRK